MFSPQNEILNDVMEVLANATVVIVLCYISVQNQHIVPLKFTQCYMSVISQCKTGEKRKCDF